MATSLQDLVNEAVFLSTETQVHFGSLIAGASWSADLSGQPSLTFEADEPLVTTPHLVGSAASGPGTWHWGWDNINDFPAVLVEHSHKVRAYGASNGITEFVDEELPLDDEELPLRLTLAAKAITGVFAHYPSEAGGGTQVWFLVEHPSLVLPEPSMVRIATVISQGLVQTVISDHRAALEAYVRRRGIHTVPLPDGGVRLLASDGAADVAFDEQNRIVKFEMDAPLTGEAAEQYAAATGTPVAGGPGTRPAEATDPQRTDALGAPPQEAPAAPADPSRTAAAGATETAGAGAPGAGTPGTGTPGTGSPGTGTPGTDSPGVGAPERQDSPAASTAGERDEPSAPKPAADAPQDHKAATEQKPEPEKKGFFKKLFGR